MTGEQLEIISDINKDIQYIQRVIQRNNNRHSDPLNRACIILESFNDKEIVEAIITTLKMQEARLETKFKNIKVEFSSEKQRK